jgi:hypothetical protein
MIYGKSIVVGYKLWAMHAADGYSFKFGVWNYLVSTIQGIFGKAVAKSDINCLHISVMYHLEILKLN